MRKAAPSHRFPDMQDSSRRRATRPPGDRDAAAVSHRIADLASPGRADTEGRRLRSGPGCPCGVRRPGVAASARHPVGESDGIRAGDVWSLAADLPVA